MQHDCEVRPGLYGIGYTVGVMDRWTQVDRWTDRWTDGQTGGQIEQTGGKMDRWSR